MSNIDKRLNACMYPCVNCGQPYNLNEPYSHKCPARYPKLRPPGKRQIRKLISKLEDHGVYCTLTKPQAELDRTILGPLLQKFRQAEKELITELLAWASLYDIEVDC